MKVKSFCDFGYSFLHTSCKIKKINSSTHMNINANQTIVEEDIILIQIDINVFHQDDTIAMAKLKWNLTAESISKSGYMKVREATRYIDTYFDEIESTTLHESELGVKASFDTIEYNGNLEYEIDITRVIQKGIKNGYSSVTLEIDNYEGSTVYNYEYYSQHIYGFLYTEPVKDCMDSTTLGELGVVHTNLLTKEMMYDLPMISTKDNVLPIVFQGVYKVGTSSILGENFVCNFEYLCEITNQRVIIYDYCNTHLHYFKLYQEEMESLKIEELVVEGEKYYSLKDDSCLVKNGNKVCIYYKNKTVKEYEYNENTKTIKIIKQYQTRRTLQQNVFHEIDYKWKENKITNTLGSEIELKYNENNKLEKLLLPRENKAICISYKQSGNQFYLSKVTIGYYYQNKITELILELEYTYDEATKRLKKINDFGNQTEYEFQYEEENTIQAFHKITKKTGLGEYKQYQYIDTTSDSEERMVKIVDQYQNSKTILIDEFHHIKAVLDKDNNYTTFRHQLNGVSNTIRSQISQFKNSKNYLENGDFLKIDENSRPKGWNIHIDNIETFYCVKDEESVLNHLNLKTLISDGPFEMKQTILQEGQEGETWTFYIWLKCNIVKEKQLSVMISCYYKGTEEPTVYYFEPNKEDMSYQLFSGRVVTKERYSKIVFEIDYKGKQFLYINQIHLNHSKSSTKAETSYDESANDIEYNGEMISYTYDKYNNPQRVKTTTGDVLSYTYDTNDKVTSIYNENNLKKVEYQYDTHYNQIQERYTDREYSQVLFQASYDENNNLLTLTEEKRKEKYRYNQNHQLMEILPKTGLATTYRYDTNGRVNEIKNALNDKKEEVHLSYTPSGLVERLYLSVMESAYIYQYDVHQRLIQVKQGDLELLKCEYNHKVNHSLTDCVTKKYYGNQSYTFNYIENKLLVESIQYKDISKDLLLYRFAYDDKEQLTQVNNVLENINTTYQYEDNQLTSVSIQKENETSPQDRYIYGYNRNGSLRQNIIQHQDIAKVYTYENANETNEYHMGGYLARIVTNYVDDTFIANRYGELMYGGGAVLKNFITSYDSKLARSSCQWNESKSTLVFQVKDINSKRIDGKLYRKNIYDKTMWDENFQKNKKLFAWVKISGDAYSDRVIVSFGSQTSMFYSFMVSSNGTLVLKHELQVVDSGLNIPLNQWILVYISISDEQIEFGINQQLAQKSNIFDKKVEDIERICFSTYYSSETKQDELNGVSGQSLPLQLELLTAVIGTTIKGRDVQKEYEEGNKYFKGYKVNPTTSLGYYNTYVYRDMEVFPLRGNLISSKGTKPKDYSYHQNSYFNDTSNFFKYDEDLHYHVYESKVENKDVTFFKTSLLEYEIELGNEATICLWAKLNLQVSNTKRTLFSLKEETNQIHCSFYVNDRGIVCMINHNTSVLSPSNIKINPKTWHHYTIGWKNKNVYIKVDNRPYERVWTNLDIPIGTYRMMIGRSFSEEEPYNLNGSLEMMAIGSTYLSEERVNEIVQNGRPISIIKEYDKEKRKSKQIVFTNRKKLTTIYRYYEPTYKKKIPTSELLPNKDEIIYTYDENNQITNKIKLDIQGNFLEGYQYQYDELKRVEQETRYKESNIFDYSYKYTYDNSGNIQFKTKLEANGQPIYIDTYQYISPFHQLESVVRKENGVERLLYQMSYQNGNYHVDTIKENEKINEVKYEGNRLIQYGGVKYKYNENGVRIGKESPEGTYEYHVQFNQIVRTVKTTATETITIDYHYERSGMVCGFHYQGKEYIYERDITENINAIIDEEGRTVVRYQYTAYGIPTIIESIDIEESKEISENNIFLYKGYCYDRETHLYWVSSRYYSPELGRFIQPADVSSLNPSSINGLNLYTYANNNPIRIAYTNSSFGGVHSGRMVSSVSLGGLSSIGNNLGYSNSFNIFAGLNLPQLNVKDLIKDTFISLSEVGSRIAWCLSKNGHAFLDFHYSAYGINGYTALDNLPSTSAKVFKGIGIGLMVLDVLEAGYYSYQNDQSFGQGALNVGLTAGKNFLVYKASTGVTMAVGTWVGAKLGASLGSAAGPVGFAIGAIAGAFVGWVIDECGDVIIDWVVGWFD